ncbi:eukaryotic translation initiation factor 3 subunit E [Mucor velutinosus]|uniref:Eukaryotic translation initiation factor 3 subunit E n=1 Tax=Mucor velutinosus TaxID=708070 RepID=A0AAN7DHD0_9FUNG|nr:eukaryotic translation initiation factor 3 subunit E [Mucor velutinosus]
MSIKLNLEDTIAFERPLTRVVKQNLTIQNPHDKPVAFKVKTTAPKLYCVRPNSDVIPPNGSIDVQIMLQAQREEPPLDVKCRDKFLILSTYVNEVTEKMGITELWNHVEENDKSKKTIHQHKLRCVYVQSKEAETNTAATPAAAPAPAANLTSITPVATAPAAAQANAAANDANTKGSQKDQEDVIEKMKAMERELNKYKEAEKLEVKTGFPPSIYILISLIIAAIAYFITTK